MQIHWMYRLAAVIVIAAACLIAGYSAGAQHVPDKGAETTLKPGEVMRVHKKVITAEELIARVWDFESVLKPHERVLANSLTYLRDTALLEIEGDRQNLKLTDAEVDAETVRLIDSIKQMVRQQTRGMIPYEEWLKEQGLEKDTFEIYLRDRAWVILMKRILTRYFEETEPYIESKHILVKTLDKANELHKRLQAVAPNKLDEYFEDLAVQHSEDPGAGVTRGKLPRAYENDGSLVKEASDALWKLKDGEISGPVKTDYGYHIFKRDRTLTPVKRPLKDMRDELIKRPERQDEELYFNRWVRWTFNTQKYEVERRLPGYDVKPNK